MPTLKAIRRRIASVKSTQQITRAMKLVAAARLRRAQEALTNAVPYHEAVKDLASSLLVSEPSLLAPTPEAHPAALMIVVGSDRGQCGGYNANLLREAEEQARRMTRDRLEVRMFAVGRKVLDHFRRANQKLTGDSVNNVPKLATVALARELAARALADFRAGEVREVSIVYSHFRSVLSQRPALERLLPIEAPKESAKTPVDYLIEPSRAELIPIVLKSYLESSVFHALLEAEASEQGARMTAMDSATNNAGEMIERLTLDMNRARQAAITRELMDIVGGAEALRGATQ